MSGSAGTDDWTPELEELRAIHRASAELVRTTPVLSLRSLAERCGGAVSVKAENLQRTGSFKLRGALSKLRDVTAESHRGVVAGSAGNHAQSLAYAARAREIPCTVFMPETAAVSKVAAVEAFGAVVRQHRGSVDDCVEEARQVADRDGLLFVHPFDDPEIVRGQAGLGLELLDQVPELTQVVLPVGGGGLASGVAAAVKLQRPEVRVVGVQASGCAAFPASLDARRPVEIASAQTIADGIAIKRPGALTLRLLERWMDDLAVVDDDAIARAMMLLLERGKLVTEGAGAAAVAALLTGAVRPLRRGTTVAVLSGGNVDARLLAAVINRHETAQGRRTRVLARVPDRPGGLAGLLNVVAEGGGNVLDVVHVRDEASLELDETGVELVLETRGPRHVNALLERAAVAGYSVAARE